MQLKRFIAKSFFPRKYVKIILSNAYIVYENIINTTLFFRTKIINLMNIRLTDQNFLNDGASSSRNSMISHWVKELSRSCPWRTCW